MKFVLKQKFAFERNSMSRQQLHILVCKTNPTVMGLLILNVFLYRRDLRIAHGEGPITGLPGKCLGEQFLVVNPLRRVGFHAADGIRQRDCG